MNVVELEFRKGWRGEKMRLEMSNDDWALEKALEFVRPANQAPCTKQELLPLSLRRTVENVELK